MSVFLFAYLCQAIDKAPILNILVSLLPYQSAEVCGIEIFEDYSARAKRLTRRSAKRLYSYFSIPANAQEVPVRAFEASRVVTQLRSRAPRHGAKTPKWSDKSMPLKIIGA